MQSNYAIEPFYPQAQQIHDMPISIYFMFMRCKEKNTSADNNIKYNLLIYIYIFHCSPCTRMPVRRKCVIILFRDGLCKREREKTVAER